MADNNKETAALDSLKKILEKLGGQFTAIFDVQEALSELKEIDTCLTKISNANAGLSKADLRQIGNDAFEAAEKYGKSAEAYLSAYQAASNAGYRNAGDIAGLSLAAQNAGDMTQELADRYIDAADKAYGLNGSVKRLTEALDGGNAIADHNAVNMAELAEGMSAAGDTAASLGVGIDEATAALGTMIAVTQQSGTEAAQALEKILLNIRQVTDEEKGIDAEGLAKYEKACQALNVSLKETKNGVTALRDPMAVLRELSEEYTKLGSSDARRTNLLDAVGGKTEAEAFNAILENYDMYSQMLTQYADGTGSMAAEAEKTASSWEGALNRLSSTWTETVGNVADSDAVVTTADALNGLLGIINNVTGALGFLGSIGLGAGLFAGIKNVGRDKMFSLIHC